MLRQKASVSTLYTSTLTPTRLLPLLHRNTASFDYRKALELRPADPGLEDDLTRVQQRLADATLNPAPQQDA